MSKKKGFSKEFFLEQLNTAGALKETKAKNVVHRSLVKVRNVSIGLVLAAIALDEFSHLEVLKWIRKGRKLTEILSDQFVLYENLSKYLINDTNLNDIEKWKTVLDLPYVWPAKGGEDDWCKLFGHVPDHCKDLGGILRNDVVSTGQSEVPDQIETKEQIEVFCSEDDIRDIPITSELKAEETSEFTMREPLNVVDDENMENIEGITKDEVKMKKNEPENSKSVSENLENIQDKIDLPQRAANENILINEKENLETIGKNDSESFSHYKRLHEETTSLFKESEEPKRKRRKHPRELKAGQKKCTTICQKQLFNYKKKLKYAIRILNGYSKYKAKRRHIKKNVKSHNHTSKERNSINSNFTIKISENRLGSKKRKTEIQSQRKDIKRLCEENKVVTRKLNFQSYSLENDDKSENSESDEEENLGKISEIITDLPNYNSSKSENLTEIESDNLEECQDFWAPIVNDSDDNDDNVDNSDIDSDDNDDNSDNDGDYNNELIDEDIIVNNDNNDDSNISDDMQNNDRNTQKDEDTSYNDNSNNDSNDDNDFGYQKDEKNIHKNIAEVPTTGKNNESGYFCEDDNPQDAIDKSSQNPDDSAQVKVITKENDIMKEKHIVQHTKENENNYNCSSNNEKPITNLRLSNQDKEKITEGKIVDDISEINPLNEITSVLENNDENIIKLDNLQDQKCKPKDETRNDLPSTEYDLIFMKEKSISIVNQSLNDSGIDILNPKNVQNETDLDISDSFIMDRKQESTIPKDQENNLSTIVLETNKQVTNINETEIKPDSVVGNETKENKENTPRKEPETADSIIDELLSQIKQRRSSHETENENIFKTSSDTGETKIAEESSMTAANEPVVTQATPALLPNDEVSGKTDEDMEKNKSLENMDIDHITIRLNENKDEDMKNQSAAEVLETPRKVSRSKSKDKRGSDEKEEVKERRSSRKERKDRSNKSEKKTGKTSKSSEKRSHKSDDCYKIKERSSNRRRSSDVTKSQISSFIESIRCNTEYEKDINTRSVDRSHSRSKGRDEQRKKGSVFKRMGSRESEDEDRKNLYVKTRSGRRTSARRSSIMEPAADVIVSKGGYRCEICRNSYKDKDIHLANPLHEKNRNIQVRKLIEQEDCLVLQHSTGNIKCLWCKVLLIGPDNSKEHLTSPKHLEAVKEATSDSDSTLVKKDKGGFWCKVCFKIVQDKAKHLTDPEHKTKADMKDTTQVELLKILTKEEDCLQQCVSGEIECVWCHLKMSDLGIVKRHLNGVLHRNICERKDLDKLSTKAPIDILPAESSTHFVTEENPSKEYENKDKEIISCKISQDKEPSPEEKEKAREDALIKSGIIRKTEAGAYLCTKCNFASRLLESTEKHFDEHQGKTHSVTEEGLGDAKKKPETGTSKMAISNENIGFKMLAALGWKEGEGLGKDKEGMLEPVPCEVKNNRTGIGSTIDTPLKIDSTKEHNIVAQNRKIRNKINTDRMEENQFNRVIVDLLKLRKSNKLKFQKVLFDEMKARKNPYSFILQCLERCPNLYKPKQDIQASAFLEALQLFKKRTGDTDKFHKYVDEYILDDLMEIIPKMKNNDIKTLFISSFGLPDMDEEKRLKFEPLIREMMSSKQYKDACSLISTFKLHQQFLGEPLIIPLYLSCNDVDTVDKFINGNIDHQKEFLTCLDKLCGVTGYYRVLLREYGVENKNISNMKPNAFSDIATKLLKKYDMEASHCPYTLNKRLSGSLQYVFKKAYEEKSIQPSTFSSLVHDIVKDNRQMQNLMMNYFCQYQDHNAALPYVVKYKIPFAHLPKKIKSLYSNLPPRQLNNLKLSMKNGMKEVIETWDEPLPEYYQLTLSKEDVIIVDDIEKFVSCMDKAREASLVAVDAEWKPSFGFSNGEEEIVLLQLAFDKQAFLIDFLKLSSLLDEKHWIMLIDIFKNEKINKLGYAFNDNLRILKSMNPTMVKKFVNLRNMLDLKDFQDQLVLKCPKIFKFEHKNNKLLSGMVCQCFGRPLNKVEEFSNWCARPLTVGQIKYSAQDAQCLIDIYNYLEETCKSEKLPDWKMIEGKYKVTRFARDNNSLIKTKYPEVQKTNHSMATRLSKTPVKTPVKNRLSIAVQSSKVAKMKNPPMPNIKKKKVDTLHHTRASRTRSSKTTCVTTDKKSEASPFGEYEVLERVSADRSCKKRSYQEDKRTSPKVEEKSSIFRRLSQQDGDKTPHVNSSHESRNKRQKYFDYDRDDSLDFSAQIRKLSAERELPNKCIKESISDKPVQKSDLFCTICRKPLLYEPIEKHIQSKNHHINVISWLNHVEECKDNDVDEKQKDEISQLANFNKSIELLEIGTKEKETYKCLVCNLHLTNVSSLNEHVCTENHIMIASVILLTKEDTWSTEIFIKSDKKVDKSGSHQHEFAEKILIPKSFNKHYFISKLCDSGALKCNILRSNKVQVKLKNIPNITIGLVVASKSLKFFNDNNIIQWINPGTSLSYLVQDQMDFYDRLVMYLKRKLSIEIFEKWESLLDKRKYIWPKEVDGWAKVFGDVPDICKNITIKGEQLVLEESVDETQSSQTQNKEILETDNENNKVETAKGTQLIMEESLNGAQSSQNLNKEIIEKMDIEKSKEADFSEIDRCKDNKSIEKENEMMPKVADIEEKDKGMNLIRFDKSLIDDPSIKDFKSSAKENQNVLEIIDTNNKEEKKEKKVDSYLDTLYSLISNKEDNEKVLGINDTENKNKQDKDEVNIDKSKVRYPSLRNVKSSKKENEKKLEIINIDDEKDTTDDLIIDKVIINKSSIKEAEIRDGADIKQIIECKDSTKKTDDPSMLGSNHDVISTIQDESLNAISNGIKQLENLVNNINKSVPADISTNSEKQLISIDESIGSPINDAKFRNKIDSDDDISISNSPEASDNIAKEVACDKDKNLVSVNSNTYKQNDESVPTDTVIDNNIDEENEDEENDDSKIRYKFDSDNDMVKCNPPQAINIVSKEVACNKNKNMVSPNSNNLVQINRKRIKDSIQALKDEISGNNSQYTKSPNNINENKDKNSNLVLQNKWFKKNIQVPKKEVFVKNSQNNKSTNDIKENKTPSSVIQIQKNRIKESIQALKKEVNENNTPKNEILSKNKANEIYVCESCTDEGHTFNTDKSIDCEAAEEFHRKSFTKNPFKKIIILGQGVDSQQLNNLKKIPNVTFKEISIDYQKNEEYLQILSNMIKDTNNTLWILLPNVLNLFYNSSYCNAHFANLNCKNPIYMKKYLRSLTKEKYNEVIKFNFKILQSLGENSAFVMIPSIPQRILDCNHTLIVHEILHNCKCPPSICSPDVNTTHFMNSFNMFEGIWIKTAQDIIKKQGLHSTVLSNYISKKYPVLEIFHKPSMEVFQTPGNRFQLWQKFMASFIREMKTEAIFLEKSATKTKLDGNISVKSQSARAVSTNSTGKIVKIVDQAKVTEADAKKLDEISKTNTKKLEESSKISTSKSDENADNLDGVDKTNSKNLNEVNEINTKKPDEKTEASSKNFADALKTNTNKSNEDIETSVKTNNVVKPNTDKSDKVVESNTKNSEKVIQEGEKKTDKVTEAKSKKVEDINATNKRTKIEAPKDSTKKFSSVDCASISKSNKEIRKYNRVSSDRIDRYWTTDNSTMQKENLVFCGGIDKYRTTGRSLFSYFFIFGEITSIIIPPSDQLHYIGLGHINRGYAFVYFRYEWSLEKIMSYVSHMIDGKVVEIRTSLEKKVPEKFTDLSLVAFVVSPELSGEIIGQGDRTINEIKKESGAFVEKSQRTISFVISGKKGEVESAKRLINKALGEIKPYYFEMEDHNKEVVNGKLIENRTLFYLPTGLSRLLLGKGTFAIGKIHFQSGALIQQDENGQVFTLLGKSWQIDSAKKLVTQALKGRKLQFFRNRNPPKLLVKRMTEMQDLLTASISSRIFRVPSQLCEYILRKNGFDFEGIKKESGASCCMSTKKSDMNSKDETFIIKGTKKQIDCATKLLNKVIDKSILDLQMENTFDASIYTVMLIDGGSEEAFTLDIEVQKLLEWTGLIQVSGREFFCLACLMKLSFWSLKEIQIHAHSHEHKISVIFAQSRKRIRNKLESRKDFVTMRLINIMVPDSSYTPMEARIFNCQQSWYSLSCTSQPSMSASSYVAGGGYYVEHSQHEQDSYVGLSQCYDGVDAVSYYYSEYPDVLYCSQFYKRPAHSVQRSYKYPASYAFGGNPTPANYDSLYNKYDYSGSYAYARDPATAHYDPRISGPSPSMIGYEHQRPLASYHASSVEKRSSGSTRVEKANNSIKRNNPTSPLKPNIIDHSETESNSTSTLEELSPSLTRTVISDADAVLIGNALVSLNNICDKLGVIGLSLQAVLSKIVVDSAHLTEMSKDLDFKLTMNCAKVKIEHLFASTDEENLKDELKKALDNIMFIMKFYK